MSAGAVVLGALLAFVVIVLVGLAVGFRPSVIAVAGVWSWWAPTPEVHWLLLTSTIASGLLVAVLLKRIPRLVRRIRRRR